jgi:hypothetical protein
MNRVARPFQDVESLLEERESQRAIEALLVHRAALIHILRGSLTELHDHRRVIAGTPAEAEDMSRIKYWEGVLAWVKDQQGPHVILMSRKIV